MTGYKTQAKNLQTEAAYQRNRFSRFTLAEELENAADSIAALAAIIELQQVEQERKAQRPTNFDRVTASPEALAEFLDSLPIMDGPWDDAFQRTFCDACQAEDCDTAPCPHEAERNSPAWWLGLEVTK